MRGLRLGACHIHPSLLALNARAPIAQQCGPVNAAMRKCCHGTGFDPKVNQIGCWPAARPNEIRSNSYMYCVLLEESQSRELIVRRPNRDRVPNQHRAPICTVYNPRFTKPACKKDLKIDTCEGNVGGGEEYHQDWARGLRGEGPAGSCAP